MEKLTKEEKRLSQLTFDEMRRETANTISLNLNLIQTQQEAQFGIAEKKRQAAVAKRNRIEEAKRKKT